MSNHPPIQWISVENLEQPTRLGNLCLWLSHEKLNAYLDSEDKVLDRFRQVSRTERKTVCQQYNRCRFFMSQWKEGETPKLMEDRIEVYHHGGYYWAPEGKHRICAAIQSGVTQIPVPVQDVDYTVKPLPSLGQPGRFHAEWTYDHRHRQWSGHLFYLYADYMHSRNDRHVIREYLGRGPHTLAETETEIIPKVHIRYTRRVQRRFWKPFITHFHVTVAIDPDLPLGKIWLVQVPFDQGWPNLLHREDLFRRGRIRPQTCPEFLF